MPITNAVLTTSLSDTFNNMFNYRLDMVTAKHIQSSYTVSELDALGQIHNIRLHDLPISEKCHVLTHLFSLSSIDETSFVDLQKKLNCRQELIASKFGDQRTTHYDYLV